MRFKYIIWTFVLILLISNVMAVVNSDSWDSTAYSFNKTHDGVWLVDDCDAINYDNWNPSYMTGFTIDAGKCSLDGKNVLLWANTNHSINLSLGVVIEARYFARSDHGQNFDCLFGISNGSAYGSYCQPVYGTGGYFGVGGDTNHYWLRLSGQGTTGENSYFSNYQPYFNASPNTLFIEYDRGVEQYGVATVDLTNYRAFYPMMATYNNNDPRTPNWKLDDIRMYKDTSKALINFTVEAEGAAQSSLNVSFWNNDTDTIIDSATTDANGLAQLNLSKGGITRDLPINITVTVSGGGTVHLNETVRGYNVEGIYPGDVFLYDMGGAAVYYSTVSLNSPADNTHNNSFINNYCYTPDFNSTITGCNLYTNETGSWAVEETDASITNGSLNCFNHNIAVDGYYLWNVYCTGDTTETAGSNYTIIIDTADPDITINDGLNNSIVNATNLIEVDFTASDEYIYNMEYIIFNSTNTNVSYGYNSTLSGNTLRLNTAINISGWADGVYTVNYSASDAHTDKYWSPKVNEKSLKNGLEFTFNDKDTIGVEIENVKGKSSPKLSKITSQKITDRYIFDIQFSNDVTEFEYVITGKSIVKYDSEFSGHLIIDNKYFFDTEPLEATSVNIEGNKARIRVKVNNRDKVISESLGGLNIKTLQSTFTVDSAPPTFSHNGTNVSSPTIDDTILLFMTINDLSPSYYNFSWNYTGTFETLSSGNFTDGQNITSSQFINKSSYVCMKMYAKDLLGQSATSDNYCFNITPYRVYISIYDEGTSSLITENVTVTYTSAYGEFSETTDTGHLTTDITHAGEYSLLFTSDSYGSRTYTITIENSSTYLNAYLTQNQSTTIFTITDSDSMGVLADVLVTMYRTINGSWVAIESKYSDITGRTQFTYELEVNYKFFLSKANYDDYVFYLNPILFSSYDIEMSQTTLINYSQDYDGISIIYAPTEFTNNEAVTFSLLIASPDSLLTEYGFNISYPGGSATDTGSNALGGQLNGLVNISGATAYDFVNLEYYYITALSGRRNFTVTFPINVPEENNTFMGNKNKTYGLGIFERILIFTLIVLFVVGIATLIGVPIAGFALGLAVMGFMVYIGFVPLWLILPGFLVGIFFLMWKSGGL